MNKPWTDWTDAELADEAQTGLRGQGAVVETLRRHREALVKQQESTNRLQRTTNLLTWALIVFALVTVTLMVLQVVRR